MTNGHSSLNALRELQRQLDASDLSEAVSRIQKQLEPQRKAFGELQRQLETSGLSEVVSRMQEQLEPQREAFREIQRQLETSGLSEAVSRIQKQLEPQREAFRELQRQLETSGLSEAVSRMQEQIKLVHDQIASFRLDPDLSDAARHIDRALDISRRMTQTILTEVPSQVEPSEHEVSEEQPQSADVLRVQELRDVQHAALADALAQLFGVVGIDPYFLSIWVETITSNDVTQDEVREMNAGLINLLNLVVPPDDELDDT